jgi:hypothetical protein
MEPHLPALFWSIARSHLIQSPVIHFICLGDDAAFPDRVAAQAARHGLSCKTYRPTTLPEARLRGLRTYEGGCLGNPGSFYGRWLLAEILPPDLDRVVYLDVDVLVQADLRALLELLPEGYATAAVPDMPFGSCPDSVYRNYYLPHLQRLGISTRRGEMFNSGVLVVSLKRWRDDNLVELLHQTYEALRANGIPLLFQDQDVLNVALGGKIHALPADWNVTPLYLPVDFWARDDLSLVHILHFVTSPKPWNDHQWLKLPAQAVKIYTNARASSASSAEESLRWRTYFEWYEESTDGCPESLVPARIRLLEERMNAYKPASGAPPIRSHENWDPSQIEEQGR